MKLFVAICEGIHDTAFIGKVLTANGFLLETGSVGSLPFPINDQIKKAIEKAATDTKHIERGIVNSKIPRAIYRGDRSVVCLHTINGVSQIKEAYSIIDTYMDYKEQFRFTNNKDNIESITYNIFCDADTVGIRDRETEMNDTYGLKYVFGNKRIVHGVRTVVSGDTAFGCYVFHNINDSKKTGDLEDLILSMMNKGVNRELFKCSKVFLDEGRRLLADEEGRVVERDKEYDTANNKYMGRSNYHEKKSLISVSGQLQFSGSNNSVVILKSDYITKDDILNNDECKTIVRLFL